MKTMLVSLLENEIEGRPNIRSIDDVDIAHIVKYLRYRLYNDTFIRAVCWVCSFEFIILTVLQIALLYSIFAVWVPILLILSFLLIAQISQWINILHVNITFLNKTSNSVILSGPIKKILCVCCFNILYIISHHAFVALYCVSGVFDDFQYKIFLFGGLVILHCFISVIVVHCEQEFYKQFENIIFQQTQPV
jgi:hypothetical protein